ncbi:hypothetical protein MRX96_029114 [Rhipicephalus microplus]
MRLNVVLEAGATKNWFSTLNKFCALSTLYEPTMCATCSLRDVIVHALRRTRDPLAVQPDCVIASSTSTAAFSRGRTSRWWPPHKSVLSPISGA